MNIDIEYRGYINKGSNKHIKTIVQAPSTKR
jgi:hypothetical protein